MKSLIHFAHANGIPSASYQTMFDQLSDHYRLCQLPLFSHHDDYPVTDNWPKLKEQLIHSIERQASEPIIGVGHSLGGALNLMASIERPDLFKAVVMLDVPSLSRFESIMVRAAKKIGQMDRITPAGRTKNRRTHWPDRNSALDYFKSRKMFTNFHPQCLEDYISSALRETDNGELELGYELDIELAIYRTVPHNLAASRKQIKVPTGVLVGNSTNTVTDNQYQRMIKKVGLQGQKVEGTHMFPLEYPIDTANNIHQMLVKMGVQ
ncbi:alpha/beta hydrolase [Reinekea forsetii]|nr:alpha/beta hydrolase [Reinekea forsetii]